MDYRGLNVACIEDCGENTGGYFCMVYNFEIYAEDYFDNFCIYPDELKENPDVDFWMRKFVDEAYDQYVQEGFIVPNDTITPTLSM